MITTLYLMATMLTTRPATIPVDAEWDFSRSHHIDLVPWPADRRRAMDVLHDVATNGRVRVTVGPGKRFEHHVERVTFARRDDRLSYVALHLDEQTTADTYAMALNLARTWDLPLDRLEAWKRRVDAGQVESVLMMKSAEIPGVSLEVLKTFDPDKPFRIVFTFDWLQEQIDGEQKGEITGK